MGVKCVITGAELLEALPVAVYTTDAEGRITFFNQAAADLWGGRTFPRFWAIRTS